ncbi:MAG: amidohydrolase [Candidatus Thermoplasmatota archaeon]|nr:amidohydrolase [Candidatus Thermoplasmatota archaeon]
MDSRCADAIFYNGDIYTMDRERPLVRALAVSDGRIVGLGGMDEIKRVAPRGCERHDLGGKVVLPGFIDCHTHFLQMGLDSMGVDLSQARSRDEALGAMRAASQKTPEGEWIVATSWKESGWEDARFITRKDLDECCPRHPSVAHRVCGHLSSVNTLAIKELGIDGRTPEVDVDSSGNLTGILRESAVVIARDATAPTRAKRMKGLALAVKKAHSLGVTSVQDNGQSEDFGIYREAEAAGRLKIRIWFNMPVKDLDHVSALSITPGIGSEWLRLGGLKMFCDGALGARSAAVSEAYADDPGNIGMFVYDEREFGDIVSRANERGLQLAIHAIGDKGIGRTIAALDMALHQYPRKDHRHRIEHLELPSRSHLSMMRKLRVIASMQPNFVGEWGGTNGMYLSRLGPERTARNNPFKEVLRARVRMVFGSDCMPMSPVYGITSAVNAPYASQKISVEEAVCAYTRDAAFASFEESLKGTISEGKLADFLVLSEDPFGNPVRLSHAKVLKTVVGGKMMYERNVVNGG